MRGSYTNISGRRRWCSRLWCFGSFNDFIFCSTHSSTSLLRNKKRLPTKSWVSLHFCTGMIHIWQTTKINARRMPNTLISMTIKTNVFFREIKGDFTLWEDSNTTAGLHDFHASQASCYYKDTEFLWWRSTPLLRTAEHISCCLPALLESRAEFSAKWLQKAPKTNDFWFGCLVLLRNEGACIVNDLAHLDVNHVPYYGN